MVGHVCFNFNISQLENKDIFELRTKIGLSVWLFGKNHWFFISLNHS